MTERGNIDTDGLRRLEDRERLLKLVGFTIYYCRNQYLIFSEVVSLRKQVSTLSLSSLSVTPLLILVLKTVDVVWLNRCYIESCM